MRRYHHFQSVHAGLIFALTAWHGLEKGDTRVKETLAALPTAAPSRICSKLEISSELRPNEEINPASVILCNHLLPGQSYIFSTFGGSTTKKTYGIRLILYSILSSLRKPTFQFATPPLVSSRTYVLETSEEIPFR